MRKLMLAVLALFLLMGGATLRAQSANADPAGDWRGTATVGAPHLRIAFHIGAKSPFDNRDQATSGVPAQLAVAGQRVTLTIWQVGVFEGTLASDRQTMADVLKAERPTCPFISHGADSRR